MPRRVENRTDLVHGVHALPVGGWVAAVDWFGVVELRVTPRHEIAVEVGDVPFAVGKHRVVRRVRTQVHHCAEAGIVRLPRARVRLRQRCDRVPVDARGDPVVAAPVGNWPVVRSVQRELAFAELITVPEFQRDVKGFDRPRLVTVLIHELFVDLAHALDEFVHEVDVGRRVHPTGVLVEPLVDEELPPGDGTISVRSRCASRPGSRTMCAG